jgi:fluoride ion exporter CrcB/FEX
MMGIRGPFVEKVSFKAKKKKKSARKVPQGTDLLNVVGCLLIVGQISFSLVNISRRVSKSCLKIFKFFSAPLGLATLSYLL